MAERNTSEPGFIENAAGTMFWLTVVYMVATGVFGGEAIGEVQEIPGLASLIFFGDLWMNQHSKRIHIKKEEHPLHPFLQHGKEVHSQRRAASRPAA